MKTMMIAALAALTALAAVVRAEEPLTVKLSNGQTFTEVQVVGVEKDKIRIKHKKGSALLRYDSIGLEAAKQMGSYYPGSPLDGTTDRSTSNMIGQVKLIAEFPVQGGSESKKVYRERVTDFVTLCDSTVKMLTMTYANAEKSKAARPDVEQVLADMRSVLLYAEVMRATHTKEAKSVR